MLNVATKPPDIKVPGWQLHSLTGGLESHWSVTVNGNWRLTLTFQGENAILVDYQDCH